MKGTVCKRPCANCPFRADGAGIELQPGRIEEIAAYLRADDTRTFVCHKSLDTQRATCAGAVGLMAKEGRLPLIARLALRFGVISQADIDASAELVMELSMIRFELRGDFWKYTGDEAARIARVLGLTLLKGRHSKSHAGRCQSQLEGREHSREFQGSIAAADPEAHPLAKAAANQGAQVDARACDVAMWHAWTRLY